MRNRIAGYWAAQLLPFADAAAMGAYLDFQTAAYEALAVGRLTWPAAVATGLMAASADRPTETRRSERSVDVVKPAR